MDATEFNTIIGIIGGIVGVVGIVVTIRGFCTKKVITVSSKTKVYASHFMKGSFSFDYSNNNGLFSIGETPFLFNTKWSKASNTSIYAYKDGAEIDAIALLKAPVDIEHLTHFDADFSSRVRTAKIGDAILWRNTNGNYAVTKIISIKDDTRGDSKDQLECEYVILK